MAIFRPAAGRQAHPARRDSKYFNVFLRLIPLIAGRLPPLKVRDLRLDLAIPPQAGLILGQPPSGKRAGVYFFGPIV